MKRHSAILAGTALGLLMASAPLGAAPFPSFDPTPAAKGAARDVILVQGRQDRQDDEAAPEEAPAEEQAEPEAAPAEEAPARAEQPPAEAPAEQQAQPEPAPAEEAPARAEQPPAKAPAEQKARPEAAPAEEAPARAEQPPAEAPAEQQAQPEAAPAEEAPAQAEQPPAEAPAEQQAQPEAAPAEEAPARAEQPPAEAPAEQQAQPEAAPAEQAPAQAEQPPAEAPAEQQAQPETPPAEGQPPADAAQTPPAAGEAPADAAQTPPAEGEAPLLDSAKEQQRDGRRPRRDRDQQASPDGQAPAEGEQPADQQAQQPAAPAAPAGPPPESDAAAQQGIQVEEIQPAIAEEGRRIELDSREARREFRRERRERRENVEVVRQLEDNRTVVQFNNQIFIESSDNDRLIRDDNDVYYEELPRGRTREVITRADGTRVVTVRNRYGDVVRRSRILADDREVVLVYVDDQRYEEGRDWRDPGRDLPPLVLDIPRDEYIFESEEASSSDDYYEFFEQPPVERITRTYSIDEVKRSARVRDIVRRVDLDTINFEFGSADIAETEVAKLEGVAQAMEKALEKNPGETFLIEGHTDAVGADLPNLALSDRRAESVAEALSNVFGIPPENLATQGYGEQYLKVNTEERERENRRVAIRRITPLVAPVAQAN